MNINRTLIAPHSAADMYALVDDIAAYPQFLSWCSATHIRRDPTDPGQVWARLHIRYRGFATAFATRNLHTPSDSIAMRLADSPLGPLKTLNGEWRFIPIAPRRCRIHFTLGYQFANPLLALAAGRAFAYAFDRLADQFITRATQTRRDITVDLVRTATPEADPIRLHLPAGATVADALTAAALPPTTATTAPPTSIYGHPRPATAKLADGDRIELNTPLPNPPRQARRDRQTKP